MNKDKLTVALFGGSGATGQQIIAQAVQQGILIRGLVRESSSLGEHGEHVVQITGSLDDPDALDQTLEGANAVSIVFGPKPPYKDIFCAAATESILRAMHRAGIQRVICQTGAMIGTYPRERTLLFDLMARFYRRTVPQVAADREQQERLIKESNLEWTIIKPPRLTNGPKSKQFHASPNVKVGLLSSVSRIDIAAFTLEEILAPKHIREVIFTVG